MALASLHDDVVLDTAWLAEQCERLTGVIEQAAEIKRGTNAIRRGADKIDASYDKLRGRALAVIAEVISSATEDTTAEGRTEGSTARALGRARLIEKPAWRVAQRRSATAKSSDTTRSDSSAESRSTTCPGEGSVPGTGR